MNKFKIMFLFIYLFFKLNCFTQISIKDTIEYYENHTGFCSVYEKEGKSTVKTCRMDDNTILKRYYSQNSKEYFLTVTKLNSNLHYTRSIYNAKDFKSYSLFDGDELILECRILNSIDTSFFKEKVSDNNYYVKDENKERIQIYYCDSNDNHNGYYYRFDKCDSSTTVGSYKIFNKSDILSITCLFEKQKKIGYNSLTTAYKRNAYVMEVGTWNYYNKNMEIYRKIQFDYSGCILNE